MENRIPYSYHTFLFPFIWNKNKKFDNIQKFIELLDIEGNEKWVEDYTDISYDKITDAEFYAQTQYFKKDAASVLLKPAKSEKDEIKKYCFCVNGKKNYARTESSEADGKYMIYKGNVRYDLDINQIRLSVFDIGVALLSIELEYWGDKEVDGEMGNSRSIEDVNCINEHGRRICLPYVGTDANHTLVADKIRIKIGSFDEKENFKEIIQKFNCSSQKQPLSAGYMMKPLKLLLAGAECFTADHNEAEAKNSNKYFIEPIIDDRMYVCCLVADDELSSRLHEKDENGEYKVYTNPEIYKLAFIEKSISCPSTDEMERILRRCIYNRWTEWGTTDIITHHSLVRITSSSVVDSVIYPFLTEYVRMAELAVIQKATLIALENDCFNSSAKEIIKLQNKYVKAQQTILLDECTIQEQGVETFDRIRAELGIKDRKDSLDKRLKDLYELENLQIDKKQNFWTMLLTVVFGLFALPELILNIPELVEFFSGLFS